MPQVEPQLSAQPLPLEPFLEPPLHVRVRALLVTGPTEQVHVLAPENGYLDLNALQRATESPLTVETVDPLAPVSAVPGTYDRSLVLDDSLTAAGVLALATDEPGAYLRSDGASLLRSTEKLRIASFCKPLGDPSEATLDALHDCVSEFTERRIQERLDETLSIPPLPDAARRIIELRANPDYELNDLVHIVETDPSLAARILGWANSGLFNPEPPARDIPDAIMRVLGFEAVMNMALGLALSGTLKLPEDEVRGVCGYWKSAVFTGAATEALTQALPPERRPAGGTSYLAGLLANFGTLVIGHVFPPQYQEICRQQEANRHLPNGMVDTQVLGVSRHLAAAALLESWSIPEDVCDAVLFQHQNGAAYLGEHQTLIDLVTIAQYMLAIDGVGDYPPQLLPEQALKRVALGDEVLRGVADHLHHALADIEALARQMQS